MGERLSAAFQAAPTAAAVSGEDIDGLEFLIRIKDGRSPPPGIAVLLGMDLAEVERGRAVFEAIPTKDHYNPAGGVHGGFTATLLDSCMTCAVQSALKPGFGCHDARSEHPLYARRDRRNWPATRRGKIVHVGRQMATAEGRVTDPRGRIIAHATTSCLIFPLRAASA